MIRRYARLRSVLTAIFESPGAAGLLRSDVDPAKAARFSIALMGGIQL
jgi:hypothetical protein